MKKKRGIIKLAVTGVVLMVMAASAFASEPQRPKVMAALSEEKETKVRSVVELTPAKAFERLKDIDFIVDDDLMHKAVYQAFRHRRDRGIALALETLRLPEREVLDGKEVDRTNDHYVAKKIIEVFPRKAARRMANVYEKADAVTRGNIIRASGNIAGGDKIRMLLIKALDEKTVCGSEYPEMEGEPLRIADVAYNQLVLRYGVRDVLRTIGPEYRTEVRDYHIGVLKEKLAVE